MRKSILILSALVLTAGVASADRGRGGDEHRGGEQRGGGEHRGGGERGDRGGHEQRGGNWNGGARWNGGNRNWTGGVSVTPNYQYRRPVIVNSSPGYRYERPYVARRPIYVQRPTVGYRYYDYDQRPQLLVENYAPMAGYFWVAGAWNWNGYEWIWTAGHYDPDPAYSGYDNSGYYDNGVNYDNGYTGY